MPADAAAKGAAAKGAAAKGAAAKGAVARKKLSPAERDRVRSGKLGDYEKVIVYVNKPMLGTDQWRIVDRSDVQNMPPGIVPNARMTDAARTKCFLLHFFGHKQAVPAQIFCRVERGSYH